MSIVTLVLFGNLAASLTLRWPFRRDRWKEAYSFIFVNFLFFPTILAIAVLGAVDPNPISRPQPNAFAEPSSNGLFFRSVALGIYWIYRMPGTEPSCKFSAQPRLECAFPETPMRRSMLPARFLRQDILTNLAA
jgi:nitrate reductase NapE component